MMNTVAGVLLLLLSLSVGLYALQYQNPILNQDFPDPCVMQDPSDGMFYVYGTQTTYNGKRINIQAAYSHNLVNWTYHGEVLPHIPSYSTGPYTWAPDVQKHGGFYFMYFGCSYKSGGMCLSVATSKHPLGPFIPYKDPIKCDTGFVDIDPKSIDDDKTGRIFLYWGSNFFPLRFQELDASRLYFKSGSVMQNIIYPEPKSDYASLVEASWVQKHGDEYFYYYSGNNCCGPTAHYAVMVAKSKSLLGPWIKMETALHTNSSVILKLNGRWKAPGHNSVWANDKGEQWMIYHAIDPYHANNGERRVLLMDRINFRENGWPIVHNGSPSVDAQPAPTLK